MKHTHRRYATALAAAALSIGGLVTTIAPAFAGTAATRLMTCSKTLTMKPRSYLLSCADANARFQGVTWSSWTSTSASGRGVLVENNCTPYCAAGKFINYSASVTLGKVISVTGRGRLFSEAYFRYTVKGKVVTQAFGLAY